MFQKSMAIYLAVFIGVGIDPGCCLRAWISNAAASFLTAPLLVGLRESSRDTNAAGSSCCQQSCCVESNETRSDSEFAKASSGDSCCSESGYCCSRHDVKTTLGVFDWNGENGCKCELSKPLESFSWDSSVWSPVLLHVWFSEPNELPAGAIPATLAREVVCVASPQERLAELCRWNC